jgi:hypothetical protein
MISFNGFNIQHFTIKKDVYIKKKIISQWREGAVKPTISVRYQLLAERLKYVVVNT